MKILILCIFLISLATVSRGVSQEKLPAYDQVPIKLELPKRLERSQHEFEGWRSSGDVAVRKPSATERYLEVEKTKRDGDRDPRIWVRFKFKGVLPSCVLSFKWKSAQATDELVLSGELSAPHSKLSEREIRKEKRETKTGMCSVGSRNVVRNEIKASPTAEWTAVRVPFDFGSRGVKSLDETFTLTLGFSGSQFNVLIDDMQLEPLEEK